MKSTNSKRAGHPTTKICDNMILYTTKKHEKYQKHKGSGVIECGQKRSSDKKAPKARGGGVSEFGQNRTSNKKHEKQEGVV